MNTIDLTPTWEQILPAILLSRDAIKEEIARTGTYTPEQQENLKLLDAELRKMAQLADNLVERLKNPNKLYLTDEQKVEFFYNALCNGLGWVCNSYGLQLIYDENEYDNANEAWRSVNKGSDACFEDVLLQLLKQNGKLTIKDLEGNEDDAVITWNLMLERMDHVPQDRLKQMLEGEDDAETADVIIQTVFFNEVIYG